ncbi:putative sterigmatocystin biosynthesis monooxygenase stcW [Glarea lozoyensis 74030]|uniref:Putative sterigmatocystin biosynthesis monooxygenase stcW n=1 Tax=Glarea lozoyensis (strain ATCC 74030 / MF5533) TaxID=1104152 RepID=H0EJY2_GLAL7|nr:putative sterigmatocystin biosynthesis monooxygenase stcW [Glarea lozoyensis 74030]
MTSNVSYAVSERPLGTPRHVRIVTIGAGASGINMIRTLREKLSDYEHVVYDKNPSVGGTWYENRYPGCRCDIPAHNYQFSWKKNPAWKLFDDFCHFLLDATGILNKWKWPDIPGLNNFKGDLLHTANWPKDFEYSGKRVAVIGNGSSGVQLVPAIQKESILEDIKMEGDKYTPEQIEKFASDPEYYLKYMKIVEEQINNRFPGTIKDSDIARYTKQALTQYMKATLKGDEKLIKALVPDFAVGCRRLTPAIGYLESLSAENVRVVTDTITEVGEHTIKTSTREEIEIDVLICATGFDDLWKDALPRAYMSSSVPGFPNYFMFLGPNAPIGHGSVFTITEHVATYIANIILKCQTESILSLAPSTEALDDFYEHINAFMPRTAWASTCRSWFKNGKEDGPVTALHPGSVRLLKVRGFSTGR